MQRWHRRPFNEPDAAHELPITVTFDRTYTKVSQIQDTKEFQVISRIQRPHNCKLSTRSHSGDNWFVTEKDVPMCTGEGIGEMQRRKIAVLDMRPRNLAASRA